MTISFISRFSQFTGRCSERIAERFGNGNLLGLGKCWKWSCLQSCAQPRLESIFQEYRKIIGLYFTKNYYTNFICTNFTSFHLEKRRQRDEHQNVKSPNKIICALFCTLIWIYLICWDRDYVHGWYKTQYLIIYSRKQGLHFAYRFDVLRLTWEIKRK